MDEAIASSSLKAGMTIATRGSRPASTAGRYARLSAKRLTMKAATTIPYAAKYGSMKSIRANAAL